MGWRKRWRSKSDETCEHGVIEASASIHAIIHHFRKLSSSLSLLLPALSPLSPFHCFMKIRSNFSGPLSHRVMRRQLPSFYQHQHQLLTSNSNSNSTSFWPAAALLQKNQPKVRLNQHHLFTCTGNASFTTKVSTKSTIESAPSAPVGLIFIQQCSWWV